MSDFKVGDKVRLIKTEVTDEYYNIIYDMLEEPEVLTIDDIGDGHYGELIIVKENMYSYHPSWLEKVPELKIGDIVKVPKIIMGKFFGNPKEYGWKCNDELFNEIEVGSVVIVNTIHGHQLIEVSSKIETTKPDTRIYQDVISIVDFLK